MQEAEPSPQEERVGVWSVDLAGARVWQPHQWVATGAPVKPGERREAVSAQQSIFINLYLLNGKERIPWLKIKIYFPHSALCFSSLYFYAIIWRPTGRLPAVEYPGALSELPSRWQCPRAPGLRIRAIQRPLYSEDSWEHGRGSPSVSPSGISGSLAGV